MGNKKKNQGLGWSVTDGQHLYQDEEATVRILRGMHSSIWSSTALLAAPLTWPEIARDTKGSGIFSLITVQERPLFALVGVYHYSVGGEWERERESRARERAKTCWSQTDQCKAVFRLVEYRTSSTQSIINMSLKGSIFFFPLSPKYCTISLAVQHRRPRACMQNLRWIWITCLCFGQGITRRPCFWVSIKVWPVYPRPHEALYRDHSWWWSVLFVIFPHTTIGHGWEKLGKKQVSMVFGDEHVRWSCQWIHSCYRVQITVEGEKRRKQQTGKRPSHTSTITPVQAMCVCARVCKLSEDLGGGKKKLALARREGRPRKSYPNLFHSLHCNNKSHVSLPPSPHAMW